jgi:hypothetical protein
MENNFNIGFFKKYTWFCHYYGNYVTIISNVLFLFKKNPLVLLAKFNGISNYL